MSASPPSTDWQEVVAPDENERFEDYAQKLHALQKGRVKDNKTPRALHAKQLLGARAEFTVLPDLPEYARVGIFATPQTFPSWVRFSNGSGGTQHDRKGDVRGFAIKLIGVEGKKVIQALASARTQDFLMIHTPSTPFRNADDFMFFALNASSPLTLLPKLIGRFGLRRTFAMLGQLKNGALRPIPTLAGERYFSALPIKYGPYAVHYAVKPSAALSAPSGESSAADFLNQDLIARLKQGPLRFDFMVQFFKNKEATPIEDASVEWKESDAPFITVARIEISQQDLTSAEGQRVQEYIEKLSFDPWHATEDFRPLGDMMRARNTAYRVSTQARGAAKEPDDATLP